MIYTADYLIEQRKEKWNKNHDLEFDRQLRESISTEILNNVSLRNEIQKYPEKLIELLFVVVNKEQKLEPFFLNEVQNEFIDILNKAISDFNEGLITDITLLILKGRQQGFTTFVTAYQLASTMLNKNFQGFTLADVSDNVEAIFQNKAKFPYSQIPESIKPTEKFNNKRQFLFEKLNSTWAADTATKDVGRSRTINFFHGSECAFWNCGISSIQAALGEAFTKNCIKIYESTANGYNDYEKMWSSGTCINCFFAWWKTKEYYTNFESEKIRLSFINKIDTLNDWIYERLRWLRDEIELKEEQLYWYYKKYNSYIEKDLIKQEYPCSAEEAFLMSGRTVFDSNSIINRLNQLKDTKPIAQGYFKYNDKKAKSNIIDDIEWINDSNGPIMLYELVKEGHPYVMGGDTAGDGSDYNAGWMIDNSNGRNVAKLRMQLDETEFTRQIYCLGLYFNEALVGLEINYSTYPTKKLKEYNYPNLYRRNIEDNISEDILDKYGFRTDKITRPIIINTLIQVFKDYINTIYDKDTLEEAKTFIYNGKMRPEAQIGAHDDLIMSAAITHYIRKQQSYDVKKISQKSEDILPFELKEENKITDEYVGW